MARVPARKRELIAAYERLKVRQLLTARNARKGR